MAQNLKTNGKQLIMREIKFLTFSKILRLSRRIDAILKLRRVLKSLNTF